MLTLKKVSESADVTCYDEGHAFGWTSFYCEQSAWHSYHSLLEGSGKEKTSAFFNSNVIFSSIVLTSYFLYLIVTFGSNLDVCAP